MSGRRWVNPVGSSSSSATRANLPFSQIAGWTARPGATRSSSSTSRTASNPKSGHRASPSSSAGSVGAAYNDTSASAGVRTRIDHVTASGYSVEQAASSRPGSPAASTVTDIHEVGSENVGASTHRSLSTLSTPGRLSTCLSSSSNSCVGRSKWVSLIIQANITRAPITKPTAASTRTDNHQALHDLGPWALGALALRRLDRFWRDRRRHRIASVRCSRRHRTYRGRVTLIWRDP